MQTLVIYDIPDDKLRSKVATICKDYGLTRIQYSAFLGNLNRNRFEELFLRVSRELGSLDGSIIVLPVCDRDIGQALEIDNRAASPTVPASTGAFDKKGAA